MAQKTINIVYDVNTQSIITARDQVNQAKAATDALTQSAKTLGDTGAAGAQKFSNTIDGLKVQMQQMKALIELTSQSDTTLLNQRIAQYKEMQAQLDKYNQGLRDTKTQTDNVGSSINSLGSLVKSVLTVGLIKETVSATLEMAKLAGQVDGVSRAFARLPNSTLLLNSLREATHGTLDDLTLMQKAVQAQNFKIPLEQLATLLEFASIKAQQTGLDIDYLTNSLITGLGRNSIRLLDNLQISVTELREKTKELGSQQQAVFFLVNEQMKNMGGYIENSATKTDQLSAAWKNFKIVFAQSLEEGGGLSYFVDLLNKAVTGWSMLLQGGDKFKENLNLKDAADQVSQLTKSFGTDAQAVKDFSDLLDKAGAKQTLQIEQLKDKLKEANDAKITLAAPVMGMGAMLPQADIAGTDKNKIQSEIDALTQQNAVNREKVRLLNEYYDSLTKKAIPAEDNNLDSIDKVDKAIQKLTEDWKAATTFSERAVLKLQIQTLETQKGQMEDPDKAARDAKAAFDKANEEVAKGLRAQSEELIKGNKNNVNDITNNSWYKELLKESQKSNKQLLDGDKLAHKEQEDEEDAHQKRMKKLMAFAGSQLFTNARQIATELTQLDVQKYDERIQALQDYYSNQEALAGDNSKLVTKLQKEEADKQKQLEKEKAAAQKKANIRKIEIDTAANVIRSILENGGIPFGLPFGAIAAAMGLAQVALVNKFATGVIDLKGKGTETSDSIPAMLSKGESVMTAEETRNSGNILRSIRAKKLNDQVLDRLTITTEGISFDDSRIVNQLKKNQTPDYARQFSTLYETKIIGKNTRRIIRSKSFTT